MNVYDFDGTVYDGDSSVDFWLWCARRHPAVLRRLPCFAVVAVRHAVGETGTNGLKSAFFSLLADVDAAAEADAFWDSHIGRIRPWYLEGRRADDVIASASPRFLLEPVCRRLGVESLVATELDIGTGRLCGPNCKGPEKARRFLAAFPGGQVDGFWSDSLSDAPMAKLAREAHFVSQGMPGPWPGTLG